MKAITATKQNAGKLDLKLPPKAKRSEATDHEYIKVGELHVELAQHTHLRPGGPTARPALRGSAGSSTSTSSRRLRAAVAGLATRNRRGHVCFIGRGRSQCA